MRIAALALLTGCGSLLGLDDNFAVPDAGITHRVGVSGVSRVTYHTELASPTLPDDLTRYAIDAYTVDGGGIHVYPGTATADGTFDIPDVPATDYYLRLTPPTGELPQIFHLEGHDVDLSFDRMGKPDATPLTAQSPLVLSAAAMQRYTSQDSLTLYSALDPFEVTPQWSANPPVLGVDRLTGATLDWSGHVALDDNGGWVSHVRSDSSPALGIQRTAIAEAAHIGAVHQTSGVALPLALSFSAGEARQHALVIDLAALRTRRTASSSAVLDIRATPDGGAGLAQGPRLLDAFWYAGNAGTPGRALSATVAYHDPFPTGWSRSASLLYFNPTRQLTRGTPTGAFGFGDYTRLVEVAAPGESLEVPTLVTPLAGATHVLLDDTPITDRVHAPDAAIRLRWDPIPSATSYTVVVSVLSAGPQFDGITVSSALPEVVIPAGALPAPRWVAIQIVAQTGAPFEPAVRRLPRRASQRGTFAGLLYLSATCGNGALDPGEACDTRGESATCNFDCTLVRCGDGVLDRAAGEACDAGMTDAECDAQCHVGACGDGVKSDLEPCDDGNTASGDGCSAACDIEVDPAKCNNGTLDRGEACDDGNAVDTDSCTPMCQPTYCGDGVLQSRPFAPEECDDGNARSGDGCSGECKIERCGDALLVYPEQCDDGNLASGDGCSGLCLRE